MSRLHQDWLAQVETDGPFLSLPVLKDMWPDGMDRLSDVDDRLVAFKENHAAWETAFDRSRSGSVEEYGRAVASWIDVVLDDLALWGPHRVAAAGLSGDLVVRSPGETITVRPDGGLGGRDDELVCLLRVVPSTESLHAAGLDGWSASEIDRMAALLRKAHVAIGVVTDGRWWALVWTGEGTTTGSGVVDGLTWREEPQLRDAFLTVVNASSLRHKNPERRLPRLFERSVLEAEEITEALGVQVRKSVELLVQSFSEARLAARAKGSVDPLCEDPDEIYQAAVTVMMRVVFLLFAEERGMLPTAELYRAAYGISDLLDDLQARARREGEENLDHSSDVWHRLLAVSSALYSGANFDEVRMPAYGGSLFDPQRFPWLAAERPDGGLRLRVSDRTVLHVLESVQVAKVGGQALRISFRDVDVEQIGYIYEGLLGYTCREVDADVVLGLVGKEGEEPEIDLDTVANIYDQSTGGTDFAARLTEWVKQTQPAAKLVSAAKLAKLYDAEVDEAEMNRLLKPVAGDDHDLLTALVDWSNYIRRDLRELPYVVPRGGLVVSETPSRKNAGAHYTPRSLAEEVVLHALQPLVYEPGPLQTKDEDAWRLKSSSAILDLKIADIAAGSGAFLVAAARYLADRLVEAWTAEGIVDADHVDGNLRTRAIREVIAHCLYGADINGMAVEMCKLSLWLVSLDPTKPFSFVDDKIFHGNSLLGLTSIDQLRHRRVDPKPMMFEQLTAYVDAETVLHEVVRIRRQLATAVDDRDPQRTRNGKHQLLRQSQQLTAKLRLIADGIVATALRLGGKPGAPLDDAYKGLEGALITALPADDTRGDPADLERIIDQGLTPTVPTDYRRWTPLHWIIEVPDVLLEHGGFDAIVGNPPFMYGRDISTAHGPELRRWYLNILSEGRDGVADLSVYFLRRATGLAAANATLGLIATDSIAQGDSRDVGLTPLLAEGLAWIYRSTKSTRWPTRSAKVRIAKLWLAMGPSDPQSLLAQCDGRHVHRIDAALEPAGRTLSDPVKLLENKGLAFMGANLNGIGFLMDPSEARRMIVAEPTNREVLLPYLTGDDLNDSPNLAASRFAVNFHDWDLARASHYKEPLKHLERNLRAYRQGLTNKPKLQHFWWIYERRAVALSAALSGRTDVLAISLVSKYLTPTRVPAAQLFSHKVGVFVDCSFASIAILSSGVHSIWAERFGSTRGVGLNYSLTDIFQTFPRPMPNDELARTGRAIAEAREHVMTSRDVGLTATYNLFHNPECCDADIVELRAAHLDLDRVMLDSYGWGDLDTSVSFYPRHKESRLECSPDVKAELLNRLIEENHQRAGSSRRLDRDRRIR
ncbi:type IIL restriction-modification enzyme MmeI [Geodermatophilus sp. Leaf369]|uniref:Eco57I restriction-modification methylase domain-containing protein n=1 Tax=Geodermatophilus sp. Leaf369 TaxID=1736354 RepID=UPI0019106F02|nr:type IIL restriction-modification enzyme MmeI [Geodermatophilus sp. Leaf369]